VGFDIFRKKHKLKRGEKDEAGTPLERLKDYQKKEPRRNDLGK
jgi:hypothetical protein